MRTSSAGVRGVAADGIRMECISKQLAPALEIHEEKWIARDGKPPRRRLPLAVSECALAGMEFGSRWVLGTHGRSAYADDLART